MSAQLRFAFLLDITTRLFFFVMTPHLKINWICEKTTITQLNILNYVGILLLGDYFAVLKINKNLEVKSQANFNDPLSGFYVSRYEGFPAILLLISLVTL